MPRSMGVPPQRALRQARARALAGAVMHRVSVPGCGTTEIQTPFVARVLRSAGNTPYIVRVEARGHHKDVMDESCPCRRSALSSFPGREIIPKSGDFAGKPVLRHRTNTRDRSAARCLPFGLRSARPEDAYPNDKTAVFVDSSGQNSLGAAAPRMGHAAHGKGARRRGLPCWPAHGGSSWHCDSRRL